MSKETVLPQGFLSGIKGKAFMTDFSHQEIWGKGTFFTSREAARSREGVVLPGEEEEDVCLKKGFLDSRFMVASLFGLLWLQ